MTQFKQDPRSSTQIAYDILREMQEEKKSWLTRDEIYLKLQTKIPYLTRETGTTLEDTIKILEKRGIVKDLGENRFYISFN